MAILPNISEIRSLLEQSKEILVVTHENPNQDSLGSSLALFLSLSLSGKKVTIACPTPSTVAFSNLIGIDKVEPSLSGKNFIISLDYIEGSIEKVSYNVANDKFNLVIEPRPGAPTFGPEKVHFSSAQATPDLIFVLDCASLEELGKFYQDEKEIYSKITTINIDYHPNNLQFAKINLVEPNASSTSEIVAFFIQSLGLSLTQDMATNLLIGIESATHNFSLAQTSAGAFEATALCLKAGGKRGLLPEKETLKEAPADWLQPKIYKSAKTPSSQIPRDESTLL